MSHLNHSPVYNLKAVLKETGLKADVLRAWERRYNLPHPQRTAGGHRLYSEYDIETVKWLRARQAEGLSISRAVELWNEIIEADSDPLIEYHPAGSSIAPYQPPVADTRIEILRKNWLEASLAFDDSRGDEILNQAFAIYPVETVCIEILQRGLSEIGNFWYANQASVQQEHFISTSATRRLETLITASPRPTRPQTILLGCPTNERHTFSALLLSLLLRRRGLEVIYLGADIPIERIGETASTIHPDLIILAAQQLTTAATLQATIRALQDLGIPLAYGGLIFNRVPRLRERIPAHFLGETLDQAIQNIERLLSGPPAIPPANMVMNYQQLANLYREKRPFIAVALFEALRKKNLSMDYLEEANALFGDGLTAALILGDPAFLEADLGWIKQLLASRHIRENVLSSFMTAYSQAISEAIGHVGAPITEWIAAYLAENEARR